MRVLPFIAIVATMCAVLLAEEPGQPTHDGTVSAEKVARDILKASADGVRQQFLRLDDKEGVQLVDHWEAQLLRDDKAVDAMCEYIRNHLGAKPQAEEAMKLVTNTCAVFGAADPKDCKQRLDLFKTEGFWPACIERDIASRVADRVASEHPADEEATARQPIAGAADAATVAPRADKAKGTVPPSKRVVEDVASMMAEVDNNAYFKIYNKNGSTHPATEPTSQNSKQQ